MEDLRFGWIQTGKTRWIIYRRRIGSRDGGEVMAVATTEANARQIVEALNK